MVKYNKEEKQIVIPNGLGNVNIVINQGGEGGGECRLTELNYIPEISDLDSEGLFIRTPEEGYDGFSRVVIGAERIYAAGLEQGRAECGGEGGEDCPLSEIYDAYALSQDVLNGVVVDKEVYVKGAITAIDEVSTRYGNATYMIDGVFKVFRGKWFNGESFTDENQIQVGDWVIVRGTTQNYEGQPQFIAGSMIVHLIRCGSGGCTVGSGIKEISENGTYQYYSSEDGLDGWNEIEVRVNVPQDGSGEGGSCNLEDKWVTPSMGDRDDNGYVVVEEGEGYDGLSRVVIDPQTIYNEGVEAGRAEGGEGGGSVDGCILTDRTFTSNGTYRASDPYNINMLDFSRNGAFDSKLKVSENTTLSMYFKFKDEITDLMSFYGCEDGDWTNSTFAARYYGGRIEVKIGTRDWGFDVSEYNLNDGQIHYFKVGKNFGIELDGRMLVTSEQINNETEFVPSQRTIYIGAINSTGIEDDGLNLFWRPFNGYIGPVKIVGEYENGAEVTFNYEPGGFGWWGEYKVIETGEIIKNIYTEQAQVTLTQNTVYPNANGFGEVKVALDIRDKNITVYNKKEHIESNWEGAAGYNRIDIDATNLYNGAKEEGENSIKGNLGVFDVTSNGRYEAGIINVAKNIFKFNNETGLFVTDFTPRFDSAYINQNGFMIEVQARVSSEEGVNKIILGRSSERNYENAESGINEVILKANVDATTLWMCGVKTYNMPTINDEWVTYRITTDGLYFKRELQQEWEHLGWENGHPSDNWNNRSNDANLAIGGYNTHYDGAIPDFQGEIQYVRIVQGDYDKTWVPSIDGNLQVGGTEQVISVQDGNAPEYSLWSFKTGHYGWKKINVNVAPKIDIAGTGVKFADSTFSTVPEWIDFSNVTDMSNMFYNCFNLITIPLINTSKVTDMRAMFYWCINLSSIPQLDTSNVTDMSAMFYECRNLTTIPQLDTSNVTDMRSMFSNCNNLTSIPQLDTRRVIKMDNMFNGCNNLTNLGGFISLKKSIDFTSASKLTRESVLNVFNNMAEVTTNETITLHTDVYSQLTFEDFDIATQKGWTVQSS